MNEKRPINLDLTTMKFPPMAIVSILHRLSGVALFLLFPLVLYWLSLSLRSMDSFQMVQAKLANPVNKLLLWTFLSALVYHLTAGIRHVLMDMGLGESLKAGRISSYVVLIVFSVLIVFLGIWIW